ncbi:hypothetical protein NFI96_010283 [Prochilodus magdalenae]|nr:hypothetical protein NFI96_010283 [Prochilodus magdalenae]
MDGLLHLNSTSANDTGTKTEPEIQSTISPNVLNQTADVKEKLFSGDLTTSHSASEMTINQSSKGNETFASFYPSEGTERNTTADQVTATERPAGTESPHHTESVVTNSSSGSTSLTGSSAHTVEPRGVTNKQTTHSVVAIATATNRPPAPRTISLPSTTNQPAPTKSTSPSTTSGHVKKGHICPTEAPKREGQVGYCLLAIALLAALVVLFIMSTVILATKLAAARYRNRVGLLQDTEMVCISALVNDTEHPVPKPRHPKSNGALIPNTEDEDGDDLTLNSFLPDTEAH